MNTIEAVEFIKARAIPKSVIAHIAAVPVPYVSDWSNGRTISKIGTDKIIAAVTDIHAFVEFVSKQGFTPDLRNGEQLREWIARWKAQSREVTA